MEFKVNEKLTIEIKEFKPYRVAKKVQMALLGDVKVDTAGVNKSKKLDMPNIPLENMFKANEVLVVGMTSLTDEMLDDLTETEFNTILEKVNSLETVPTVAPGEK